MAWNWVDIIGVVTTLVVYAALRRRVPHIGTEPSQWPENLKPLGLTRATVAKGKQLAFEGVVDGMELRIEYRTDSGEILSKEDGRGRTWITLQSGGRIPQGLAIIALKAGDPMGARPSYDRVIGDPVLDQAYLLSGSDGRLLAILDGMTRERLMSLSRVGWLRVERGSVRLVEDGLCIKPSVSVERVIGLAQAVAFRDDEIAERLASNLAFEHLPEVRRNMYRVLFSSHIDTDAAQRLLPTALADKDNAVRVYANLAEDRHGVGRIGVLLDDGSLSDELRALVASTLPRRRSSGVLPLLRRALESLDAPPLLALLEALAAFPHPEISQALAAAFPRVHPLLDSALLCAWIRAWGALGDSSMEETLSGLLEHEEGPVQIEAARALGKVGTLASVEPLMALKERGLFPSSEVKSAAQNAVAAIQQRAGGGERGALSIGGEVDRVGAVSLDPASDAVGGLSEPEG